MLEKINEIYNKIDKGNNHIQLLKKTETAIDIKNLNQSYDYLKFDEVDLLNDFINSAIEILSAAEASLLILESNPNDENLINELFRGIHTLKGDSGFLKLKEIQIVSHTFETLLGKCRSKTLNIDREKITVFLETLDILKQLFSNLIMRVQFLKKEIIEYTIVEVDIAGIINKLNILLNGGKIEVLQAVPETAPVQLNINRTPDALYTDVIRVPQKKIEDAEEMVGELLIALSLLKQNRHILQITDRETGEKFHQLEQIVELLQSNILKMKMYPIGGIFNKLNRIVRDLSEKTGKNFIFESVGDEVEIDKTVIDEIYSPLMHIIRNSVDHGLETPSVRKEKGKFDTGTILLKAENVGDNVIIEIKDDGAGLNKEKILAKAIEKNLIKKGVELSDKEIFNFIFAPGFSTADIVTDISGRGVGMDVVRTTVERLGGSVDISSEIGKGTHISIKLPLSSSIIEGLIVSIGKSKFIFPMIKILSTLTPELNSIKYIFESSGMFIIFKNKITPVIKLGEYYRISGYEQNPEKAVTIMIESVGKYFGVMVDDVLYKQKVVSKSFKDRFNVGGLKSGTILGDGSVGFILEPNELIRSFLYK